MKQETLYDCEIEYQVTEYGGPRKVEKRKVQTAIHPDQWGYKNYEQIQKYLTRTHTNRCEINIIKVKPLTNK